MPERSGDQERLPGRGRLPRHDDVDRDGDGIPDDIDKCPDDPEDKDNFEDADGCPDPDNDKDGIPDKNDLCPNDPEDKDGFEDQDGCPDPDNDHDGIPDKNDKCPNEPETYNGYQDDDGCPDKGKVIVHKGKLEILDKIYFETDKDEIKSVSFPLLDAIAATINGNPQIELIEIQGHADERGDDAHNLDLTERRAHSVRVALEQRNVVPSRLKSHGYGETKPICNAAQRGLLEPEPPRRVHHPQALRRSPAPGRRRPVARPAEGPKASSRTRARSAKAGEGPSQGRFDTPTRLLLCPKAVARPVKAVARPVKAVGSKARRPNP